MTSEAWNQAKPSFRRQILFHIGVSRAKLDHFVELSFFELPGWLAIKLKKLAHYFPEADLTEKST